MGLQEFPFSQLDIFKSEDYEEYEIAYTFDAIANVNKGGGMLILTAINKRHSIKGVNTKTYFDEKYTSLLNKIFYRYISKMSEKDDALIVNLQDVQIVNMRLSTATNPTNRMVTLTRVINILSGKSIICGDFNTTGSKIFTLLTGLFRGYSLHDYILDEYNERNKLINARGYKNCFLGGFSSFRLSSGVFFP